MRQGWEVKRLGGVVKLEYGKPLPTKHRDDDGAYPAYGANGVKCRSKKFYFSKRSIIVGRKGSAGEVTLTEEKFWPLDVTYFVTFDERRYDLMFLYHCLKYLDLTRLANGVKPGINRNDVYSIEFAFPPLAEQKRIVAILDEAFAGIALAAANAEKNLASARKLFESQLQAVYTERHASGTLKRLADVCDDITVGHVGSMATQYQNDGIPFLRSQNIRPFQVSLENIVFVSESFHRSLIKSRLKPGDVVVVRTGYPGTAAVIPDTLPVSNCADLVIVRPGPAADPHYLALFFNSQLGKELVAGRLVGAAQKHFNVTAAKQVAISFPPIAEQRRCVGEMKVFANETARLTSVYRQKLAALAELKQTILQKAFAGELTAEAQGGQAKSPPHPEEARSAVSKDERRTHRQQATSAPPPFETLASQAPQGEGF